MTSPFAALPDELLLRALTYADGPFVALPDELLLRSLMTYADKRSVFAAAGTCRRWRDIIYGEKSAPLWKHMVEVYHPALLGRASRVPFNNNGWKDLFLDTQRLVVAVGDRLRRELMNFANGIHEDGEIIFGSISGSDPYDFPTTGTTATSTPDAHGAFSEPVYYDWGANWDRVSELIPTQAVQAVLKNCVDEADDGDGYYFSSWDENKIWPFLFVSHGRYGDGQQDALMHRYLPPEFVRELNGRWADWYRDRGERLLFDNYNRTVLTNHVEWFIESRDIVDEDECAQIMVEDEMFIQGLYELYYGDTSAEQLEYNNMSEAEAFLYRKDSPIGAILLCTWMNSWAFMPLNYILAKLLSPKGTELKVYASHQYSVVVDERRNIVFDNFWYFIGQSPSVTLEKSRDLPQLTPDKFDYSLGGLAH